jgi:hypothetical protein
MWLKILVNAIWAYFVLAHFAEPSSDTGGYSPTMHLPWWSPPLASNQEYFESLWIRTLYQIPHMVYGMFFAVMGCGLRDWLVGRFGRLRGISLAGELSLATVLVCVVPMVSDLGLNLGLWSGMQWGFWGDLIEAARLFFQVWLPIGVACALSSVGMDGWRKRASDLRPPRSWYSWLLE